MRLTLVFYSLLSQIIYLQNEKETIICGCLVQKLLMYEVNEFLRLTRACGLHNIHVSLSVCDNKSNIFFEFHGLDLSLKGERLMYHRKFAADT